MPLTARQQRFVEEFLVDANASQAAIRAGYSRKTAKQQGSRLLTNVDVQSALSEAMKQRSDRVQADADRVLRELTELLEVDVRDFFDDGWRPLKVQELSPAASRALSSLEVDSETGRIRKLRFVDRLRVLELVGKHVQVRAWNTPANRESDVPLVIVRDFAGSRDQGAPRPRILASGD